MPTPTKWANLNRKIEMGPTHKLTKKEIDMLFPPRKSSLKKKSSPKKKSPSPSKKKSPPKKKSSSPIALKKHSNTSKFLKSSRYLSVV